MNTHISIGVAERDLNQVLANLAFGETATLADENGEPIALLVSLQSTTTTKENTETNAPDFTEGLKLIPGVHDIGKKNDDWVEQMKALAARVDAAWQGEKSGLDELAEMRR